MQAQGLHIEQIKKQWYILPTDEANACMIER